MSLFLYFCVLVFPLCVHPCACICDCLPIFLLLCLCLLCCCVCVCVCVSVVRLSETEGFHSTLHGCTRKPSRGCEVSSGERSQSEHSNRGTEELREVFKDPISQIPRSPSRLAVFPFCFVLISLSPHISFSLSQSANSLLCAAGWIHSSRRGSSAGT